VLKFDAGPLDLEAVNAGDELRRRPHADAHVGQPAAAHDAERHGREAAHGIHLRADGGRDHRLTGTRRELGERPVEVGQQQQVPPPGVLLDFRGDGM
jgi:hypothetical protein